MGVVYFADAAEVPVQRASEINPIRVKPDEPDALMRYLTAADGPIPCVQLVQFEPNRHSAPHSHPTSEFIFVLEGEGRLGDRPLKPGVLVYVEKDTVYGPVVGGPAGMKFLRVELPA
jgi:hypothetical protein